jgi:O-acetyl-ADP-ribose deacetylase (regulator of RNase III)
MEISRFFKNYFSGFQELCNLKDNKTKTNVLAALKILSYFTIVIPLGFYAIYGLDSICGRISKKKCLSLADENIILQIKKYLSSSQIDQPEIIQTEISKTLHNYTNDLTSSEKEKLQVNFIDDNTLQILFKENPTFHVNIRREDIFDSKAEVIVNTANNRLRQGGGIDGEIHTRGGLKYKEAQLKLQRQYSSKYISGHAAMIESGSLKESHGIDNVIVVTGPQGETEPDKENALYSCYYNSLVLAENQNKISIAFPSVSTGIFEFPKDRAASISLKAIYDFIKDHPDTTLKNISIYFLVEDEKSNLEIYQTAAT